MPKREMTCPHKPRVSECADCMAILKPNEALDLYEMLDKVFTKLQLVEVGEDGTNIYSESKPFLSQITEAKAKIEAYVTTRVIDELEKILEAGYDDMHKTHDYNRIVESLFDRITELKGTKDES